MTGHGVRSLTVALLAGLGLVAAPGVVAGQGVAVLVVDEHHQPFEGAEGRVGDLIGTSGPDGMLFILGLPPGRHELVVRAAGYLPDLRPVEVQAGPPTRLTVRLQPAVRGPPVTPVPSARTGVHGVIVSESLQRLAGAEVHLYGRQGRTVRTDSAGAFHQPVPGGLYLVRVAARGFRERRFSLDLPEGGGRELVVRLAAVDTSYHGTTNAEQGVLRQLGRRLASGPPASRLTRAELQRFGFRSLCSIPQVAATGRRADAGELPGLADGVRTVNVCTFRANEVELVELRPRVIVWIAQ